MDPENPEIPDSDTAEPPTEALGSAALSDEVTPPIYSATEGWERTGPVQADGKVVIRRPNNTGAYDLVRVPAEQYVSDPAPTELPTAEVVPEPEPTAPEPGPQPAEPDAPEAPPPAAAGEQNDLDRLTERFRTPELAEELKEQFAKRLERLESPESLPKSMIEEIKRDIAQRYLDSLPPNVRGRYPNYLVPTLMSAMDVSDENLEHLKQEHQHLPIVYEYSRPQPEAPPAIEADALSPELQAVANEAYNPRQILDLKSRIDRRLEAMGTDGPVSDEQKSAIQRWVAHEYLEGKNLPADDLGRFTGDGQVILNNMLDMLNLDPALLHHFALQADAADGRVVRTDRLPGEDDLGYFLRTTNEANLKRLKEQNERRRFFENIDYITQTELEKMSPLRRLLVKGIGIGILSLSIFGLGGTTIYAGGRSRERLADWMKKKNFGDKLRNAAKTQTTVPETK